MLHVRAKIKVSWLVGLERLLFWSVCTFQVLIDCLQPSIVSCVFIFSIDERAVRTARELDTSAKWHAPRLLCLLFCVQKIERLWTV